MRDVMILISKAAAASSVLGVALWGVVLVTAPAVVGTPAPPASPSATAVTEDSAGWDCLRQGNVTCRIDGVLVTSLEGLPSDPFARCVFLLEISRRVDPDGLTYADTVCGPIRQQLG